MLLSKDDIEKLKKDLDTYVGKPKVVKCVYRGCDELGEYFMRRLLRGGKWQEGLFCDEHERRFGEENLRRWEREKRRK